MGVRTGRPVRIEFSAVRAGILEGYRLGRESLLRQTTHPTAIREIAWKA